MEKLDNSLFTEWAKRMENKFGVCEKQKEQVEDLATRRLKESELYKRMKVQRFDNYKTSNKETREALELCKLFSKNKESKSLLLCGKSGVGKTHLITAVCGALADQGKIVKEAKYSEMVSVLKSLTVDYENREHELKKYKSPYVLFIDDLFKGDVTSAELKTTFEIIDYRYTNDKITLFTSEKTLENMNKIANGEAEAIKSRILEMAKGFFYEFKETKNYRDVLAFAQQKNILLQIKEK